MAQLRSPSPSLPDPADKFPSGPSVQGPIVRNAQGLPINPAMPNSSIVGKGKLYYWGANPTGDFLALRLPADAKQNDLSEGHNLPVDKFRVALIARGDTGRLAWPGGFCNLLSGDNDDDAKDQATTTSPPPPNQLRFEDGKTAALREFKEEALSLTPEKPDWHTFDEELKRFSEVVYQGDIGDSRSTPNAWIETTAVLSVITESLAKRMTLTAGDDAKDVQWYTIGECLTMARNAADQLKDVPAEEALRYGGAMVFHANHFMLLQKCIDWIEAKRRVL